MLLAKRGYRVHVYERLSREETLRTSQRSINISFHDYTERAFKTAGIWDEVKKDILPLDGSVTKLPHYPAILASFRDLKIAYYSARREHLLGALIHKAAQYPNLTFHFNSALISVNRNDRTFMVQNLRTGTMKTIHTDLIVGADGVHSLTRAFLQQGQHTSHMLHKTGWEYKQISFPREAVKALKLNPKRAYSSTRRNAIFVALPNKDGTFSGMLALPKENGFAELKSDKKVTDFITAVFPELAGGLPYIIPALRQNPNGSFITLKTFPWIYKDLMVLVGDAAHSVTPFIGHGVTVGLGDCLALVKLIDRYKGNWTKVLPDYQELRKKHADIMVDMSMESFANFQRERKASYGIIYARLESVLHRLLPDVFSASTFERIVFDPDYAHTYMKHHLRQRRRLKFLGVPLLVRLTTYGILSLEISAQLLRHSSGRKPTVLYTDLTK